MSFEDFSKKESVVVVYTGDGKGKTSAALGLLMRALGREWSCAFVQFIKTWQVGEHNFLAAIEPQLDNKLTFYKGGKGFYNAKDLSAENVSDDEHKLAAEETYKFALESVSSGNYQLVICDEVNNAVHDGLLSEEQLEKLIDAKHRDTSLCLTGRNFPPQLIAKCDIVTNMSKLKHHFDDKFLANEGIDF